jgi:acetyl esterase
MVAPPFADALARAPAAPVVMPRIDFVHITVAHARTDTGMLDHLAQNSRTVRLLPSLFLGAAMNNTVSAAAPNVATDPHLDPRVREFLVQIGKDPSPFWELPQPKPQEILTVLQKLTPVDVSGSRPLSGPSRRMAPRFEIYIMKPEHPTGKSEILFFVHGGVWIVVGNFENHKRFLRDLVVGCGQVGVFVEYTPLPAAKYPTQLNECYTALTWTAPMPANSAPTAVALRSLEIQSAVT